MDAAGEVLAAARALVPAGLAVGTAGNVSARVGRDRVVVTPASVPYDELTAGDLVTLDLDGAVVAGRREPSTERALHLACYRAYAEVGAVLHTHPPYATAFACAGMPVPALVDEMVLHVGGPVPCAPYAPSGTPELGRVAAARLAGVGSVLLANHGLVTVAATPAEALRQACVVEHAARVALAVATLGVPAEVPRAAAERFAAAYRERRGGAGRPG